jgi:RNA polymerase sigma-70 factor (ECF subfamily)
VVHEAFLRCVAADPGPAAGKELAYLRRAVMNLANNHHRTQRRAAARLVVQAATADPPEERTIDRAVAGSVAAAVRRLPPRQRDCVLLHYFAHLTDVEIAAELELSAGSVKTHLHRARAALRPMLEELR